MQPPPIQVRLAYPSQTANGLDAIGAWADSDIFAPNVTLEVIHFTDRDGETVITTKVDGNFDRTGLPDPVISDSITAADTSLTWRY